MLDQGQGHQEGQDQQHRPAVDAEGVLAVLPGAVHEDVQRLHMLQGEERDAGVNQEHPKENARAAEDHQCQRQRLERRPAYRAGGDRPGQHNGGLEQPGQHGGLHVLAQHLEEQRTGPEHDPVKLRLGENTSKCVDPPGEAFRQRGPRQNYRIAQRQLGQGVAAHGLEAVHQKRHAEEHIGGNKQVS